MAGSLIIHSNNAFLIFTFLILLVWRSLSQKRLRKELELQYELNREREKLAQDDPEERCPEGGTVRTVAPYRGRREPDRTGMSCGVIGS